MTLWMCGYVTSWLVDKLQFKTLYMGPSYLISTLQSHKTLEFLGWGQGSLMITDQEPKIWNSVFLYELHTLQLGLAYLSRTTLVGPLNLLTHEGQLLQEVVV